MDKDGDMYLSKSHSYFYQLQTQMHVTNPQWSDFVVWSPCEIFVQRINYDSEFMKSAGKFYFEKFLPAVIPYVIMSPAVKSSASSSVLPVSVAGNGSSSLPPLSVADKGSSSVLPASVASKGSSSVLPVGVAVTCAEISSMSSLYYQHFLYKL